MLYVNKKVIIIRVETLAYLEEVAKTRSISKAAENLYLSKSSLSAAIKNLENELGVSLLNRSSYGVELTDAGEMVVKKSKIIFELFDQIKEECWIYEENEKIEEITCVMTESFANNIFPDLLRKLRQRSGGARIKTIQSNLEDMIEYVQENETCIGFYLSAKNLSEELFDNKKIVVNEINSYKVWAVTAKYSRYIRDDVKETTLEELYKYPMIGYRCDDLEEIYWVDSKNRSRYILTTDNMNIYNQAVSDDIGIGLMSGLALQAKGIQKNIIRKIYIKDIPESKLYLLTNIDCPPEIRAKYERVLLELEEQQ